MIATAKDLRVNLRHLLDALDRGEDVVITYRGEPRARLVPLDRGVDEREDGEARPLFGIWRDHEESRNVEAYVDRLRSTRR